MQTARIVGTAVATVKHPSMKGWRLLIAQPVTTSGQSDGEPQLVIDSLGAGNGTEVIISNDGQGARQLMGQEKSPVRWFVLGLCDPTPKG